MGLGDDDLDRRRFVCLSEFLDSFLRGTGPVFILFNSSIEDVASSCETHVKSPEGVFFRERREV